MCVFTMIFSFFTSALTGFKSIFKDLQFGFLTAIDEARQMLPFAPRKSDEIDDKPRAESTRVCDQVRSGSIMIRMSLDWVKDQD